MIKMAREGKHKVTLHVTDDQEREIKKLFDQHGWNYDHKGM